MQVLRRVLVVLAIGLVVTGVPLLWTYRPDAVNAWNGRGSHGDAWDLVQDLHRILSFALVQLSVVYAFLVIALRSHRARWLSSTGWLVLVLLFSFTGYLLPWEQLALYAVTVGTNIRGVLVVLGDDVKFVLVGGAEISTATYARWLGVHTVLLPLATAAGLWAVRRRVGSRPHAADPRTPELRRDDALARHGDPEPHA